MDQFQDNSGSDEDSITLQIEQGDAVIVYGCNDRRYSPPVNHVTKVIIGPDPCLGEGTIVTNDPSSNATSSGNANHKLRASFDSAEDHSCMPSQTQVKSYQELAETLSHLTMGSEGKEQVCPVSPALSKKFRNSLCKDVSPPSKNPFLMDANTTNSSVFPNGGSPRDILDLPNCTTVATGVVPLTIIQNPETNSMPLPGGPETIIDPPGAFQSSDLLGNSTILTETSESSQRSSQSAVATAGLACVDDPVSFPQNSKSGNSSSMIGPQTTPPDNTIQPQQLNDQSTAPLISKSIQSDPPTKAQIVNTPCSQELPPIQESLYAPDQSMSSFHFPEPPRPEPLVCIPVKEVKLEEPQKYQTVTALENAAEKLGKIVKITVQPCHTKRNEGKATDEPNVIAPPICSTTQFQPKAMDGSSELPTNHDNNSLAALKTNNIKTQGTEIPTNLADPEDDAEHSYGIIGNEDNLSEITLPPLAEGTANHQDHDADAYNNGHPCHRIRISIDHQSATPSRRATVITVLLVVLLMSTGILLGVYKFVFRSSPI